MEQQIAGPFGSDRELLAHLGMDDEQLACLIGRSRASIRRGLALSERSVRRRSLLIPNLLTMVRFDAYLREEVAYDDAAVVEYVRDHRGPKAAEHVYEAFALMTAPAELQTHQVLWMILPDFRHMRETGRAELLHELVALPCDLSFFTGSPVDDRSLREFLGEDAIATRTCPTVFGWDSVWAAQSTALLGDPLSDLKIYIPSDKRFIRYPIAVDGATASSTLSSLLLATALDAILPPD